MLFFFNPFLPSLTYFTQDFLPECQVHITISSLLLMCVANSVYQIHIFLLSIYIFGFFSKLMFCWVLLHSETVVSSFCFIAVHT